jgi:hypothetical protein
MAKRVVKEVHHTSSSGGSFGVLGVIIGALLVVGAIFFFAGGPPWRQRRLVGHCQYGSEQCQPGHSPDHAERAGHHWLRPGALSVRRQLIPNGRAKALPFCFGAILFLP